MPRHPPLRASVVGPITDRLIAAIATGELLPPARLPAERELAVLIGAWRTAASGREKQRADAALHRASVAGRGEEADAVAREHARIDLELLRAARERAERGRTPAAARS